MDIVSRVVGRPQPGETIRALSTELFPGGKGANQALAAARAGASVDAGAGAGTRAWLLGAVGADTFGSELRSTLAAAGVDVSHVVVKPGTSTGVAVITVDAQGENTIVISAGANDELDAADVGRSLALLDGCDVVLLQNEIHPRTLTYVMEEAARRNVPVFYNPAPVLPLADETLAKVHTLIVNTLEAEALTGISTEEEAGVEHAAEQLLQRGAGAVVVTLGEKGSYYRNAQGMRVRQDAFQVQVLDTTAAGDTFVGAFAVAICEGRTVADGIRFASAAAAIAVTRPGAQASVPHRAEIEMFLREHGCP